MRIIGGRFRGLGLTAVGKGDKAAHLRPTTDRVRESLFSLLQGGRFGDPITDAHVLDLFAGTGALGLEALSRGAAGVTFVENGRTAQRLLSSNIEKTRAKPEVTVLKRDATRLGTAPQAFDLVFLDPPYGTDLGAKALASAYSGNWLAPNALIVWEDGAEQPAPNGFSLIEARRYGETWLMLLNVNDLAT